MKPVLLLAAMLAGTAHAGTDRVLVFTRTAGFAHASIADGVQMLEALGAMHGFTVEASDDPMHFSAEGLAGFRAVVWLSTTGDVLDAGQQQAFEDWIAAGGGYVGIHAAADCEYDWPWYGAELLGGGAWFASHPAIQAATVVVEDGSDVSTAHLPSSFAFTDEWYNFRNNPRPAAQVLLRLDEASYDPGAGAMGADHPISWKRVSGAGRAWYTGLGHRTETHADERFRLHVLGGLRWAMRRELRLFADGFEP